jgi:hypothetical protein
MLITSDERALIMQHYDQREEQFNAGHQIFITVESNGSEVFDLETMKLINALTDRSWSINGVTRVDSVANFQFTFLDHNQDFIVESLIESNDALSDQQILLIKKRVAAEPEVLGHTVSHDLKRASIILSFPSNLPSEKKHGILADVKAMTQSLSEREDCCSVQLAAVDLQSYIDFSLPYTLDYQWQYVGWPSLINTDVGRTRVEYAFSASDTHELLSAKNLSQLDQFVQWLRAQKEVQHVQSLTDTLNRVGRVMNPNDATKHTVSDDSLNAQYLLLYEMSLPYGLDLANLINQQTHKMRVAVTIDSPSRSQFIHFQQRVINYLEKHRLI